jgi:hypothetical protein
MIGDKEFTVRIGSCIFKLHRIQDAFWNAGPKSARLIEIKTSRALAPYFEELHAVLSASIPPDFEKIEQLYRKYVCNYNFGLGSGLRAKFVGE